LSNTKCPFDKVFYTGLQRTKQSVQGFIDLGLPHEAVPELNEISWGRYEGVPMTHEENHYYLQTCSKDGHQVIWITRSKVEKVPILVAKRLGGDKYILAQPEKTILICMHGRAMRVLLSLLAWI
jgi:phosphoserine phosphatase